MEFRSPLPISDCVRRLEQLAAIRQYVIGKNRLFGERRLYVQSLTTTPQPPGEVAFDFRLECGSPRYPPRLQATIPLRLTGQLRADGSLTRINAAPHLEARTIIGWIALAIALFGFAVALSVVTLAREAQPETTVLMLWVATVGLSLIYPLMGLADYEAGAAASTNLLRQALTSPSGKQP